MRNEVPVLTASVIAVPDPVLGERICACIVPSSSDDPPDLEILRSHLLGKGLARYKCPEQVAIVDTMPIVGDKIDKVSLSRLVRSAS